MVAQWSVTNQAVGIVDLRHPRCGLLVFGGTSRMLVRMVLFGESRVRLTDDGRICGVVNTKNCVRVHEREEIRARRRRHAQACA